MKRHKTVLFSWPDFNLSDVFDLAEFGSYSFFCWFFIPALWGFQTALVICMNKYRVLSSGIFLKHYPLVSISAVFKYSFLLSWCKALIFYIPLVCSVCKHGIFTVLNCVGMNFTPEFIINWHFSVGKDIICFQTFQQLDGLPKAARSCCCDHHADDWAWVTMIWD